MHLCVCQPDDALVVGHLNFKIVCDLHYATTLSFQLAVDIDDVAHMQFELIIVVC